jgi:hypothetical protein
VQLTFLGVRGSLPVSGPQFMRYGGHSTCIAVSHHAGTRPTLSLDAGSGLWGMTKMIEGGPYEGSMLLSHLHWDHTLGLPFFGAGDREGSRVDVFLPAQDGKNGLELLSQMMAPPAFPITPEGLNGSWSFTAVEPGRFATDGFEVTATEVAHKGGRTYGYRIATPDASPLPLSSPNPSMRARWCSSITVRIVSTRPSTGSPTACAARSRWSWPTRVSSWTSRRGRSARPAADAARAAPPARAPAGHR